MTRRLRMILLMILAVMLCVVFSMPSLALEPDESARETEPAEVMVTEPAPQPTVEVSAPVEIAVIPDEDWGSVTPEAIAAGLYPAVTEAPPDSESNEPEETVAPEALPEETEPAETESVPPAPETTEPVTVVEETSVTEPPAEAEPAAETEQAEQPEAQDVPDEDPTTSDSGEEPEEEETVPEPEKPRVTVTVEISMIDETVMRLLAVVNDPEGRDFLYQWQVSEDSGMTFTDIPEATADELKVELTDENIDDQWRVRVQAV